jgi:hypothetical protein
LPLNPAIWYWSLRFDFHARNFLNNCDTVVLIVKHWGQGGDIAFAQPHVLCDFSKENQILKKNCKDLWQLTQSQGASCFFILKTCLVEYLWRKRELFVYFS